jgi:hypothetical protein
MNAKLLAEYRNDMLVEPCLAEVVSVEPVAPSEEPPTTGTTLGLVELLLKDPEHIDRLNRDATTDPLPLTTRFLCIAQASYLLFAVAMIIILNAASASTFGKWLPIPPARLEDGTAFALALAYCFGLTATTCICLPSFYFFTLLAGVRMTFLQIVGQVVRCKAGSAVVLLGILPIYVAVVLGLAVFDAPLDVLEVALALGLLLPFIAGLEGVRAIYRGVMGMAETLPPERRCRRECFLRRLTLSWAAVYTVVAPVMIYRLWEIFSAAIAG